MIHEVTGDILLAMPRLATGVGGMVWSVVHPLIVQQLGDLPIPICVYTTYAKGQQADEPAQSNSEVKNSSDTISAAGASSRSLFAGHCPQLDATVMTEPASQFETIPYLLCMYQRY